MILFYYPLILISVMGYGIFLSQKIINLKNINLGIVGLVGIFFLILISYISTQFVPHNIIFNSIVIFIGLFFFLYFFDYLNFNKENTIIFFSILTILIIFIMVGKNHDDFHYYHLPYILILTEYPHPIGLGHLNHGFKTHSSIFLLSSLFHLPGAKFNLFNLAPTYILFFSNFILLKIIFDKKIIKNFLFITFLSLSSFIFINIFFYRLGEHGTDRSAMILILIFSIYLLYFMNSSNFKSDQNLFKFLIIIFTLIVSLKVIYLIYILLLIPLIPYFLNKKKITELLFNVNFMLCVILFFFVILTNLLNTGCLLFPEVKTCFQSLPWSLKETTVEYLSIHYETWSKAGVGSNYGISQEEKLNYISNFNWVGNWIDRYFFNKVSDLVFSLIFFSTIYFLIFKKKNNNKIQNRNYKQLYFLLIIIFLIWFTLHPALRYGGYHLFFLIIFIPLCITLEKYSKNLENLEKKIIILVLVTCLVFIGRNLSRLGKEYKVYKYNPLNNINYSVNEFSFRYQKEIKKMLSRGKIKELYNNRIVIKK